jgi:hypothetical protein
MINLESKLSKDENTIGINFNVKNEEITITINAFYESQLHELLLTAFRVFGIPKKSFALFENKRVMDVQPTQTSIKIVIRDEHGNIFTIKQKLQHAWQVYYLADLLSNDYSQLLHNALLESNILECVNMAEKVLIDATRTVYDVSDKLVMELDG